jgi:hypothetical protein
VDWYDALALTIAGPGIAAALYLTARYLASRRR